MKTNVPSHTVYVVSGDGEKKRWTEIGAAWRHKDGEGFNVMLDALPPNGKLVLRPTATSLEQGGAQ